LRRERRKIAIPVKEPFFKERGERMEDYKGTVILRAKT
jgi:hypothetical protein